MNPNHMTQQTTRHWSTQLGKLAAELPAPTTAPPLAPRLSAILAHFRQREQTRKDMHHDLRTEEFMAP